MVKANKYEFYMRRVTVDGNGRDVFGKEINLEAEEDFAGLRYKDFTGLEDYGKPYVYQEKFADRDKSLVYVPESVDEQPVPLDSTTLKLALYFFDLDDNDNLPDAIANIDFAYHNFVNFVNGCQLIYWDTARKRKVRMFLSDSTKPKVDKLYGYFYKEVTFTFTNVYGRTFPMTHKFDGEDDE